VVALLAWTLGSGLRADDGELAVGWGANGLAGPEEGPRWNAGAESGTRGGVYGVADWDEDRLSVNAISFRNGNLGTVVLCEDEVVGVTDFEGYALLLDGRGSWIIAGAAKFGGSQTYGLVARFGHGDCELDPGWSGSGFEIFDDAPYCDTESCRIVALAEAPDDRLYALLQSPQNFLVSRFVIVAFEPDGDLDPTFGTGGLLELPLPDGVGELAGPAFLGVARHSVAPELFVFLNRYDPDVGGNDLDPFLLRIRLDAGLDTSLVIHDDDDLDQSARALAVKDHFVAVGVDTIAGATDPGYVTQYLWWPAGTGYTLWVTAWDDNGTPVAVAYQGDRKLLVAMENAAGDPDERTQIFRYAQSPTGPVPDDSFAAHPVYVDVDTLGGTADTAIALVPSPGAISVLGNATGFSAGPTPHTFTGAFELRLENRLLFADGFESGWTNFWSH
jgi:hypothetical protein